MLKIESIRKDSPACENQLFMNSAGSSLMPLSVRETMNDYLALEEQHGGYAVMEMRSGQIGNFYQEMADFLKCHTRNIAFQYSATYAFARALSSIPFEKGDYILTTDEDYISNQTAYLSLQKRMGIQLVRSKNLENGDLDLLDFEEKVKNLSPKLVAITHVPTNSGIVHPAEKIGVICKKYNCWYLLDACQSVGQFEVYPEKIGCDFLSGTGRKFLRGPRGTAFLYVSDKVLEEKLEPLFIDSRGVDWTSANEYVLHDGAQRFETFEVSYQSMVGFAEAMRYANYVGVKYISKLNKNLLSHMENGIKSIPGIKHLDLGSTRSNIITLKKEFKSLESTKAALDTKKVNYSISLRAHANIDFDKKKEEWAVRISPHYFNTIDEIDQVLQVFNDL